MQRPDIFHHLLQRLKLPLDFICPNEKYRPTDSLQFTCSLPPTLMNVETTFDILNHLHRRTIITVLDESPAIARQRLIDRILEQEAENRDANRTSRRRIRIALHHTHLPKLADAGVLKYDDETVHATPRLQTLIQGLPSQCEPAGPPHEFLDRHLEHFYA